MDTAEDMSSTEVLDATVQQANAEAATEATTEVKAEAKPAKAKPLIDPDYVFKKAPELDRGAIEALVDKEVTYPEMVAGLEAMGKQKPAAEGIVGRMGKQCRQAVYKVVAVEDYGDPQNGQIEVKIQATHPELGVAELTGVFNNQVQQAITDVHEFQAAA